jgi:hypothetical protein
MTQPTVSTLLLLEAPRSVLDGIVDEQRVSTTETKPSASEVKLQASVDSLTFLVERLINQVNALEYGMRQIAEVAYRQQQNPQWLCPICHDPRCDYMRHRMDYRGPSPFVK